MSFYLFFLHHDLKDLLLAEIKVKHPNLKLSFSNREFISMKGPEDYDAQLRKNPIVFARRMALFLEKSRQATPHSVEVKENEYWHYHTIKSPCDTFDLIPELKPVEAPARAWHKIQETCKLFSWEIQKGEKVIEIGSAPGGISYFLLERGVELTAIDPAQMDVNIKGFKHVQKSVFDVVREELPKECDWLVSDLNLNGDLNLSQCKRISDFYPGLKGGMITIKTPKESDLQSLEKWAKLLKGFKTSYFHLPSHRRELGLFFIRK